MKFRISPCSIILLVVKAISITLNLMIVTKGDLFLSDHFKCQVRGFVGCYFYLHALLWLIYFLSWSAMGWFSIVLFHWLISSVLCYWFISIVLCYWMISIVLFHWLISIVLCDWLQVVTLYYRAPEVLLPGRVQSADWSLELWMHLCRAAHSQVHQSINQYFKQLINQYINQSMFLYFFWSIWFYKFLTGLEMISKTVFSTSILNGI